MDNRHLITILQDITFYFLQNKESLLTQEKDFVFKIEIKDKGNQFQYALMKIFKNKNLLQEIKLSEITIIDKEDYILEINLYLLKLYKAIDPFIQDKAFLHICPECKEIHSNSSMYFGKNYLCDKCLCLKNNQEKKDTPKMGYIYFFESSLTGLIKIGYSNNLRRRKKEIEALQGGEVNLLRAIQTLPKYEKYIHERFNHLKTKGEWFKPDQEILFYIKKLRTEENIQK